MYPVRKSGEGRVLLLQGSAAAGFCCCRVLLLQGSAAVGFCCCRVLLLQGSAAAGFCCCRVLLMHKFKNNFYRKSLLYNVNHDIMDSNKEAAASGKGGRRMKEKLKEIFDLEWIRDFAEHNINHTEWIEEDYDGEKRKILVIETLVSGAHGAYIPSMVLELFGQAEGYDLEDPYNYEKNETIHEDLMYWENDINDYLNELLPSEGRYYVGYHEADGSYCLFYEEYEEEEEE